MSALDFLIAAKQCEIADLAGLARTVALVEAVARAVHALQRERGLSSLYVGSAGQGFDAERQTQISRTDADLALLRERLEVLDVAGVAAATAAPSLAATLAGQGARLFGRIAYALQGMDALGLLRERVARGMCAPAQVLDGYGRLIAGLLAVVFEAADVATEPEVSRLLVACFNLMQSKELAGQERATGSALWAAGAGDSPAQQRLQALVESQDAGLALFADHAPAALAQAWRAAEAGPRHQALWRLRRVLAQAGDGVVLDPASSRDWFEACTRRIDDLREAEENLMGQLRTLCQTKAGWLEGELAELKVLAQARRCQPPGRADAAGFLDHDSPPDALLAPPAQRSALDLVQAQARRLQALTAELDAARASLAERKLVERAKGLLMARQGLSEEAAHQWLRRRAMQQGRRLVQVAEALLAAPSQA